MAKAPRRARGER
uniref:Uncharacterized protein n=1 Tax=Arundo donax TaxID=35708 RepID=A0A0A9F168_ARUDO